MIRRLSVATCAAVAVLAAVGLRAAQAENVQPGATQTTISHDQAITAGGTAQTILPANPLRRSFYVFNPDATEALWCSFTTTAAVNGQGSFAIAPTSSGSSGFGMEVSPTTNALSCVAATTGHKVTAWESQ